MSIQQKLNTSKNTITRKSFINKISSATIGIGMVQSLLLKNSNAQQKLVTEYIIDGMTEIILPPVSFGNKIKLSDALSKRKSMRSFNSRKELDLQVLSNLLWSAYGINRPKTQGRTAPCAYSRMETDIYLAVKQGLYKYNPEGHKIFLSMYSDIRSYTGAQEFVKDTPLNLVYVADLSKMGSEYRTVDFWAAANCGFIAQNVYLYCAGAGLNTVVRSTFDFDKLRSKMKLSDDKYCVLVQSVGYPVL